MNTSANLGSSSRKLPALLPLHSYLSRHSPSRLPIVSELLNLYCIYIYIILMSWFSSCRSAGITENLAIECRNLSYSVSTGHGELRPILNDCSLNIPSGQLWMLLGPNGCGKSTLLKVRIYFVFQVEVDTPPRYSAYLLWFSFLNRFLLGCWVQIEGSCEWESLEVLCFKTRITRLFSALEFGLLSYSLTFVVFQSIVFRRTKIQNLVWLVDLLAGSISELLSWKTKKRACIWLGILFHPLNCLN